MKQRPPVAETSRTELPDDPAERHEALVDIFGQFVMWMRDWTVAATRELGESQVSRDQIRAISREKWESLAKLSPEDRALAYDVAEATTDRFIQMLLAMLGNQGVDQRLGREHGVRFRLDLEICDAETLEVVESETINCGGKKFFGDYWGRWINRARGRN
jgi:hypothetical protein